MECIAKHDSVVSCNSEKLLDQESVFRYSRQLILPEIGMSGQSVLLNSSVLVVGAGGLGCPAIQYLTAAGVGKIGIVDYDEVDLSNLHRQVLHTEESVAKKTHKAASAAAAVKKINSKTKIVEYHEQLSNDNALDIVKQFDVVLDATDNVPSRYLISDMCVLSNKPLVSGSALRWEGQLTVYHYKSSSDTEFGPCYRCIFPKPPLPETVTNCSEGGVLGVVPGIIGSIQALEAIKILVGLEPSYHKKLLLFDGLNCNFRTIKLRNRQHNCCACGTSPTVEVGKIPNYENFCQMSASDKCSMIHLIPLEKRLTVCAYKSLYVDVQSPHVLLDVRQPVELEICRFPNAINIPITTLQYKCENLQNMKKFEKKSLKEADLQLLDTAINDAYHKKNSIVPIVIVCKRGNDSQKALNVLTNCIRFDKEVEIKDIIGGLISWAINVDDTFLQY